MKTIQAHNGKQTKCFGNKIAALLIACLASLSNLTLAEDYIIDTKDMHATIEFKVKHLGFSWLLGRFDKFDGSFHYDEKQPNNNSVQVNIDVSSLDSNHAERDKHLRSERFFDVAKFPDARFVSTSYETTGDKQGVLKGRLTLRGVTKEVSIDVREIGAGKDPWGGFRRGFEGHTTLHLSDYTMKEAAILGAASENIELSLYIEGVRQ